MCKTVLARTPHIQGRRAGDTPRHCMPAQIGHERLRQGGAVKLTTSATMQEPSSVSAVTGWASPVLPDDCCMYVFEDAQQRAPRNDVQMTDLPTSPFHSSGKFSNDACTLVSVVAESTGRNTVTAVGRTVFDKMKTVRQEHEVRFNFLETWEDPVISNARTFLSF